MMIRREERSRGTRRRAAVVTTSVPIWKLRGDGQISGLRCLDTATLDVELSSPTSAANVTMSTSGRIWHYSRGDRCPRCSIHEKVLLYDPNGNGGRRSSSYTKTRPKPRTYFYVGDTNTARRHGWGRLMDEKRLLYEGQHDNGLIRGFYVAYHEYSVEMGALLPWGRAGVYLLADRESSVAPFAYMKEGTEDNADETTLEPYVRCHRSRHGTIVEMIGESVMAVSKPSIINRRRPRDEPASLSRSLDMHLLCPGRHWKRECSATRRLVGRSDDDTMDTTKLSSSDSLPPPPPPGFRRRRSSGNRSLDVTSAISGDRSLGDRSLADREICDRSIRDQSNATRSLGQQTCRDRRRSAVSDSENLNLTEECFVNEEDRDESFGRSTSSTPTVPESSDCVPTFATNTSEPMCACTPIQDRRPTTRRNSWPRVGQQREMQWARRAHESGPFSPLRRKVWECPERTEFSEHRWRVTPFDNLAHKRLQGLNAWSWSSEDLGRFLSAIGLPDLAYRFVHQGICGLDVKDITRERLRSEFGVEEESTILFILCVFRTLIATMDETDLLYPFHNVPKPRDCAVFSATDFVIRRRLGVGGHAVVYHAIRKESTNTTGEVTADAAVKCFPHSRKKKRVTIEQPDASPLQASATKISSRVAGTITSFRRWIRGIQKSELPTIILSKVQTTEHDNLPHRKNAGMENVVNSRSSGERARDKELLVLQSLPLHRNIIRCFGQIGGSITGVVLEFCNKGAIHDVILPCNSGGSGQASVNESLSRRQVIKYFADIARGLSVLHKAGYVHRDLKPSNFLISADGNAKLSDFGMSTEYRSVYAGYLGSYGNIYYAAPEVLLGRGFWPASDIFSLGVSFWESLTRIGSYNGMSKGEIFCTICTNQYMDLFSLSQLGSPELSYIIREMLQYDHTKRPSANDVADTLVELLNKNHAIALSRIQSLFDI